LMVSRRDIRVVLGNGGEGSRCCLGDLMSLICLSVHSHPRPPLAASHLRGGTLHPQSISSPTLCETSCLLSFYYRAME